jgi:hypothetical protein
MKTAAVPEPQVHKGWIAPKAAIRILALVSILLAIWTTYQVAQTRSLLESILWGLIFAATIWAVAGLTYLVTRWFRRN